MTEIEKEKENKDEINDINQNNKEKGNIFIPEYDETKLHYKYIIQNDTLSTIKSKFELINKRFIGFEAQLINDRDKKLHEFKEKIKKLRKSVEKLREALKLLSIQRANQTKTIQLLLNKQLHDWYVNQPPIYNAKFDEINIELIKIDKRIDVIDEQITKDYKSYEILIKQRISSLVTILADFQELYLQKKHNIGKRHNEFIELTKKVNDLYLSWFDKETKERDIDISKIMVQLPSIKSKRIKLKKEFDQIIQDSFIALNNKITKENELIQTTTDELLQQIKHYTKRLEIAIRNVSKNIE